MFPFLVVLGVLLFQIFHLISLSFLQDLLIFIRYLILYVKNDNFDISEREKLDGHKRVSKSQNGKGPKIILFAQHLVYTTDLHFLESRS